MGRISRFTGAAGVAVVLAMSWLPPPAVAAEDLDIAYVASGDVSAESPLGCVVELVSTGVELNTAIAECGLTDFSLLGMEGMHSLLGPSLGSSGGPLHATVNCGTINGQLGNDGGAGWQYQQGGWWYYGKDGYYDQDTAPGRQPAEDYYASPTYQDLADEADRQWQEYVEALKDAAYNDSGGEDPEADRVRQEKMQKELKEANEAIEERDEWRPSVSDSGDSEGESDGDGDTEDGSGDGTSDGDTGVARPSPYSACAEAAALVAECNAVQWQSPLCQQILQNMENCDDLVAISDPESGDPCMSPKDPDTETVEQVYSLVCNQHIKPEPGTDPCAGFDWSGEVLHGYVPVQGDGPPCGSPLAFTNPEDCAPSITLIGVTGSWREKVGDLLGNLGGGGFVIHLNGPRGPRN